MDDGKIGYMYIIDGYAYIDGPHWFPATAWFLLAADGQPRIAITCGGGCA
jgi:hypothetical protein